MVVISGEANDEEQFKMFLINIMGFFKGKLN